MKLINITGWDVKIYDNKGLSVIAKYPIVGSARSNHTLSNILEVDGVFIKEKKYHEPYLPEPKKDILYIVSEDVFNASERKDLITPNVDDSVREFYSGEVRGFRSFIGRR